MRLSISHTTHYSYDTQVAYSIQRLLLTPLSFASQRVVSWTIKAPGIDNALIYTDAFGNRVHLISSILGQGPHAIIAEGIVEVDDAAGLVRGLPLNLPDMVFLRQTVNTLPSARMLDMLARAPEKKGDVLAFLHGLMAAIHKAVAYETGTTHAHTTGAEAFAQGRGVCQDHAHVFIGLARARGIPARYITGYLMADAISPAAHAWAEALVPDLGWIGFDAANNICPAEHYVRVAAGLDALATAPIRGCRRGGATEEMTVEVRVEMSQQ